MCSIFVSYRRTDSSGHAGRLYDRLAKRFGSVSVFMDTETVRPGSDWPETIQSVLKTCNVVIVIIGRNWVSALRLRNTRKKIDPVHFEVAEALKTPGIVVIPVLVMGASMPSEADLPEDLSALTRQQALHLHDDQFSYSCKVLFQEIEPALSTIKGVRPTTRSRHIGTPNIVVADLKDLLALGWSVRKIIDELLALEYAMSPELTLEFSGTSDQWIPILEAHPETWRVLLNEERRIIANWHFVALGSADFKLAQTGRLLESQ